MIFGDQTFGIECLLDTQTNQPSTYHFGSICIWAAGLRLGDIEQVVLLNTPAINFKYSLVDRKDKQFETMNAEDIWNFLYKVLYDEDTDNLDPALTSEEIEVKYRRFCICPGFSEAFDGEFAFLTEGQQEERFIWLDLSTHMIKEVKLPIGTYEGIVQSFVL